MDAKKDLGPGQPVVSVAGTGSSFSGCLSEILSFLCLKSIGLIGDMSN